MFMLSASRPQIFRREDSSCPKEQLLSVDDSGRHAKHMRRAIRLASGSKCNHKHGAVVVRSGRVLSAGRNKNRNNPQYHPGLFCSVHAEVDALSRVADPAGCTVYVARVNNNGDPMLSKPCGQCAIALEAAGVARVFHT